jgi:hypothetical protein
MMKITRIADQVRNIPLREVLERYGFEAKAEGTTLRAKSDLHNIVVTGGKWFDNKAGVGGAGAIDLVIHLTRVDFSSACRSLAGDFLPSEAGRTLPSFLRSWPSHPDRKSFEELAAIYAVRDESNWPVARAYIIEQRKISQPLVDEMHSRGSLYANNHRPNPSLVFLHRDRHGKVGGATLRDTRHRPFSAPPGKQAYGLVRSRRSRRSGPRRCRRVSY